MSRLKSALELVLVRFKSRRYKGLCIAADSLKEEGSLNTKDYNAVKNYFTINLPVEAWLIDKKGNYYMQDPLEKEAINTDIIGPDVYRFEPGERTPRIDWMNKQIKSL